MRHGPFPPRRTVRADFPHTALLKTVTISQLALVSGQAFVSAPRGSSAAATRHLYYRVTRYRTHGRDHRLFRIRTHVQAALRRLLQVAHLQQGPFAPSPLRDFNTTMGLSDSRSQADSFGCSRIRRLQNGSPRFLDDLSTRAIPLHPGEPSSCMCPLLHCWW